jgi:hypothetical protein
MFFPSVPDISLVLVRWAAVVVHDKMYYRKGEANDLACTDRTPVVKRTDKMGENIEETILKRIKSPGWTTTRAIQQDPNEDPTPEELRRIEEAMMILAKQGKVTLWRLVPDHGESELMAAARPGLELDRELEERGAWAKAHRIEIDR